MIIAKISKKNPEISDSEIVDMIKNAKNDTEMVRMLYLLGDPDSKRAITDYVSALIRLARKFIESSDSGKNLIAVPWSEYVMR